jgi:hypothetical protein
MGTKVFCLLALALTSPAWGAGHGGGHANSGNNHGALVSQTAHDAKANGQSVGPAVRDVARSKSQGPSHASANGIAHANSHSVLASGSSTVTTRQTGKGHMKTKAKTHGHH